ncbi:MAG: DUF2431 domain-containing protein [Sphaerospermopsis sp. SIO1G2]|nr:DUF2431 domain-containing protein [Sphaerospermopsis sp. SIO1G2]
MNQISTICQLGIENQKLISRAIDLRRFDIVYELKHYDRRLWNLYCQKTRFDFVAHVANGRSLLVREGNMSFALSLARKKRINPENLVITTLETARNLSEEALHNAEILKSYGATVMHNVNATKLTTSLGNVQFGHIIFQFPHTGSREPIEGHNPNHILLRNFLRSAKQRLRYGGDILVTTVDSPHYHGAFQFELAAEKAGLKSPESYTFDPSDFPGYSHSMTNEDGSAVDNGTSCVTWIFRQ